MTNLIRIASASAITTACLSLANIAHASQGPGTGIGSASSTLQTTMAVVVYGLCAAVILFAAVRGVTRS